MDTPTVTIDRLGGQGDGIAETENGRIFVPLTAPGDRVRVRMTGKNSGELVELLDPGPTRIAPPCRHFGRCGGCALQHLDPGFVAGWKRETILAALATAGLSDVPVAATIAVPPGTRRRATLAAKRVAAGVVLGFAERASHQLVDLQECPVLRPELAAILPSLRTLLTKLLEQREEADIAVTLTETGIDLTLIRKRPLMLGDREALADFGEARDLARIAWRPALARPAEPVAMRRMPMVRFGGHPVALPSAGFLQPSLEGEALLTRFALDTLAGTDGAIVDLFCGFGTFALPASKIGPVSAFDGDPDAITALQSASRSLAGRVQAARRDLFRDPLTPHELNEFAAAIIDPPRAGAQAQTRMLAASNVPLIAAASCNPSSFARDAATLVGGGYTLDLVTPVDQFLWSPHIELTAVFRRP